MRLLRDYRQRMADAGYRKLLLFPVSRSERALTHEAGFRSRLVGAEAIVDLPGFSLAGKAKADLRQMVNRGTKRYRVHVDEVDPGGAAVELRHLYGHWLASRVLDEPMALLIGSPCFDRAAGRRFLVARVPDRPDPVAFVTLTPGWDGKVWGVDVMARLPDAPAGAMDVLILGAITRLRDEGARRLSLGACPMADKTPPDADDRGMMQRLFRWIYRSRLTNRLFPFQSLVHYKDKYAPRWEPVYLAAWPKVGIWSLYTGCRMWGLFWQAASRTAGVSRPQGR